MINTMQNQSHNLDIYSYSIDEIFDLFQIPRRSIFTEEDLNRMKRKVLYTHPDKSKFPPEYFIFYKKAFEIMVQYYESNCRGYSTPLIVKERSSSPKYPGASSGTCSRGGPRVSGSRVSGTRESGTRESGTRVSGSRESGSNSRVSEKSTPNKSSVRQPLYEPHNIHIASEEQVKSALSSMSARDFQQHFNTLYEQNHTDTSAQQRAKRFGWFSDSSSDIQIPENVSKSNFNDTIDHVKRTAAANAQASALIRAQNPTSYNIISGAGDLYNDILDEDEETTVGYIECDPFSKLKFDDLRKVHKDQTVFLVSERDFTPEQKHQSIDTYNRERSSAGNATPFEKARAEQMLLEQERNRQQRLAAKQYQATQIAMQNEEKSKTLISNFLRLT